MNLMPTTILLVGDSGAPSPSAAEAASDLARWFGALLYVVQVVPAAMGTEHPRVSAYCALAKGVTRCIAAGGDVAGANLRSGVAETEILAEAAEVEADLIVLSRSGDRPVGEIVAQLARCTAYPMLIVGDGEPGWPPTLVVVGDDGSIEARDASILGAIIGGAADATGLLLRSVPYLDAEEQRHAESQLLTHASRLIEMIGKPLAIEVSHAKPEIALVQTAEAAAGPALITIGTCGMGAMGRIWLGSTASKVLERTSASVLLTPPYRVGSLAAPRS